MVKSLWADITSVTPVLGLLDDFGRICMNPSIFWPNLVLNAEYKANYLHILAGNEKLGVFLEHKHLSSSLAWAKKVSFPKIIAMTRIPNNGFGKDSCVFCKTSQSMHPLVCVLAQCSVTVVNASSHNYNILTYYTFLSLSGVDLLLSAHCLNQCLCLYALTSVI